MVARHPLVQTLILERVPGLADRVDADLFHEHVWRHQREPGHRMARRVDQRDRGAVAVTHEDRRLFDSCGAEHLGQHVQRLLVHEGGRARPRRRVGLAVPEAGEGQNARARELVQGLGQPAPEAYRTEALVQHHERRRAALQELRLEPPVRDIQKHPAQR